MKFLSSGNIAEGALVSNGNTLDGLSNRVETKVDIKREQIDSGSSQLNGTTSLKKSN